ncbi:50S ribosomal protein L25/general stress protein Ctc [Paenalcaligenes suwonensis]|uniref:50S ribosomal protein L25/general stress protein Ctc n=1 Tax=Paenalcaligenes suwonensis TaxID=1202713 RepID=UPI00140CB172|nr:50S ribosomal protein L25/general stress protein Ctc [Paenalcaligenes suwonensis]NHC60774.1 50S ribosomal protein L25/general stress protein Ctc [Paenalcaligenes suwonensis]
MKFAASSRSVQGSGASRRLRRAGQVPAVVYGGNAEPQVIALDHNQIYHDLNKPAFHASILTMELDGKAQDVLVRAVQWHPYKQQVMHVDFQRVMAGEKITTRVPLNYLNGDQSPAVKLHSQVISHVAVDLEITCLPKNLPVEITVDLGGMEAGANMLLNQITLPAGVEYAGTEENPVLAAALVVGGAKAEDEGEEGESSEEA